MHARSGSDQAIPPFLARSFDHPVTGERIERRDELPWDLAAVLDDLAPRSLGRTAAGDEIVPQLGLLEA